VQEKKSLGACNSTYQRRWQGKGELRIPCPSRSLAPLLRETTGGLWLARRNEQPHLPVPHHAQAGLKSGEHDADRCHIPSIASLAGLAHDPLLVRGLRKKKPCKAISQTISLELGLRFSRNGAITRRRAARHRLEQIITKFQS
jgi:hypothetical protein